jgi:hypothetical protein
MPLHWTIPTETAEAPAYPLSETQRTALAVLLSPIIEEVAGELTAGLSNRLAEDDLLVKFLEARELAEQLEVERLVEERLDEVIDTLRGLYRSRHGEDLEEFLARVRRERGRA